MTIIGEMVGMDVLCSDKFGTLTLNKLTVDQVLFLTARASSSRTKDQDTIDAAIVGTLTDSKEICMIFFLF